MSAPGEETCIRERIQPGVSKNIRVEEDTHAALAALKGEDESFDAPAITDAVDVDVL